MATCVFGDSIVWGMCDSEGGWVKRLGRPVIILGVCGERAADLLKRIEREARENKASSIIIAIGTNDTYKELLPVTPLEGFRKDIAELIRISKNMTNKVAFIGLFPVGEEMRMYSCDNDSVQHYNNIIKGECKKSKVLFIDVFAEFIKRDYEKLLEDGLHPNSVGHKAMAEFIDPILIKNKLI
jgi:lysophospholipase L1-like esterase